MSLASLREVYNPLAIKAEQKPPLKAWRDSTTVVLLSDFIKEHKDRGIILRQTDDGIPCLSFINGLGNDDKATGRWQIAQEAEGLFMNAVDDLKELIANGILKLPISNGTIQGGQRR